MSRLADHDDSRGVWVETWVLDLLDGDQPAALMLSQILFWHQPGKNGLPKVQFERDGHKWLFRPDDEWWEEARLSVRQVRRCRKVLVEKGFIAYRRFKGNDGLPVPAVRPLLETINNNSRVTRSRHSGVTPEGNSLGSDAETSLGSDASASVPSSSVRSHQEQEPSDPWSEDVERLCSLLADLIEANGSKRPRVTDTWKTECDRLIRLDGRSPLQIENAIRWSQSDAFWRSNVLSMPKLRERYDQLRLAAKRAANSTNGHGTAHDALAEYRRRRAAR